MTPDQAVRQIRNTIFRPGWKFSASALSGGQVFVEIELDTVNTSVVSPEGAYTEPMKLPHWQRIDVTSLDEAGLAHELIRIAHQLDEHEDREFMRVRQADGTWFAPLHPHRPDGDRAWYRNEMAAALTRLGI